MKSLISSEKERIKDSDMKKLKENQEKDRVFIYDNEKKKRDVIEERERKDRIKVYKDLFMIK